MSATGLRTLITILPQCLMNLAVVPYVSVSQLYFEFPFQWKLKIPRLILLSPEILFTGNRYLKGYIVRRHTFPP